MLIIGQIRGDLLRDALKEIVMGMLELWKVVGGDTNPGDTIETAEITRIRLALDLGGRIIEILSGDNLIQVHFTIKEEAESALHDLSLVVKLIHAERIYLPDLPGFSTDPMIIRKADIKDIHLQHDMSSGKGRVTITLDDGTGYASRVLDRSNWKRIQKYIVYGLCS